MKRAVFACLLLTALGLGQPAAAADVPQVAPAGGQLVATSLARMTVPEGWSFVVRRTDMVLIASPKVPPEIFASKDPKLSDDMVTCFDLSEQRDYPESDETIEHYLSRSAAKMSDKMIKTREADARAVSFVERRNLGGGKAVVAFVADEATRFGAYFTGIVYLETRKTKIHLVCNAAFSSDKGPYADRPTMKALLQILNSFTPL